ncbi:MAG: glycosyltransferase [Myxococcota bacterium]
MAPLAEVRLGTRPLGRYVPVIGEERMRELLTAAEALRARMSGRVLWNVNSTAVGGGVAELLRSLLGYSRSAGIDARWAVIRAEPEFFHLTKQLHHFLHGSAGDGSSLGARERKTYEDTLHANALEFAAQVRAGDIVLLHDPQTLGLAPSVMAAGASVIWRCHIGADIRNEWVEAGWRFLEPYLQDVPAFVFSRSGYVPPTCDHGRSHIIQPSVDAFSPKNQDMDANRVRTILVHVGLVEGPLPEHPDYGFRREDGTPGRVVCEADVTRHGRAPAYSTPLVVQISRWDPLKDPIGVMRGFELLVDGTAPANAELVLAGPNVRAVADDPEGAAVFEQVCAAWRELPHALRSRIHLASLPTQDVEENGAIVNALQRHAAVVVQKSLFEGFGLTVTEAMWKARPIVASAVGGIQDQIENGEHGLLLKDPRDSGAFAGALRELLEKPERAARLGAAARERVRERFLGVRQLLDYARLIERLDL